MSSSISKYPIGIRKNHYIGLRDRVRDRVGLGIGLGIGLA